MHTSPIVRNLIWTILCACSPPVPVYGNFDHSFACLPCPCCCPFFLHPGTNRPIHASLLMRLAEIRTVVIVPWIFLSVFDLREKKRLLFRQCCFFAPSPRGYLHNDHSMRCRLLLFVFPPAAGIACYRPVQPCSAGVGCLSLAFCFIAGAPVLPADGFAISAVCIIYNLPECLVPPKSRCSEPCPHGDAGAGHAGENETGK